MSDPRFARLTTDPRFRRPKKHQSKVVIDERFKDIFEDGKTKGKKGRVDKYGRAISDSYARDNLRQFYRLENADDAVSEPPAVPDYARGEVLLESSDEDNEDDNREVVTLGNDQKTPIPVSRDEGEVEIELDEGDFADLDAQATVYASKLPPGNEPKEDIERTRRIAVVNLDWDHVRAIHLYKIFSSLVSPTAAVTSSSSSSVHPDRQHSIKGASSIVACGKVLSVRVYPSEFGKERMAREETEGPPMEVFKKRRDVEDEEEINEKNIHEVGDEDDYDEDALRNYQLERLRYYYAIVTCDTVDAASHIYSELDGTELERSANVFDLSFVPDGMTFDDDCRDESLDDPNTNYKSIDFVTDALRHSKVRLTWDEDDPERNQITRHTLTKQEIEEADFKAYLASSTSGSESESGGSDSQKSTVRKKGKDAKSTSRDKLRALLLGGEDDDLPEGWGRDDGEELRDVDMEITFASGLSQVNDKDKGETTLEKYERKMKEKRKRKKEELKGRVVEKEQDAIGRIDNFFDAPSEVEEQNHTVERTRKDKVNKRGRDRAASPNPPRHESSAEELALLVASDNPNAEPKHFNMKSVLKAEKKAKSKGRNGKRGGDIDDNETQEDFVLDVNDDRFKAVHEDHAFAIDPSNPHFKKTKGMSALLEERSKRQKSKRGDEGSRNIPKKTGGGRTLTSLVESIKRKSVVVEQQGSGKRRRV